MDQKCSEFSEFRESDKSRNLAHFKDPPCYLCIADGSILASYTGSSRFE